MSTDAIADDAVAIPEPAVDTRYRDSGLPREERVEILGRRGDEVGAGVLVHILEDPDERLAGGGFVEERNRACGLGDR